MSYTLDLCPRIVVALSHYAEANPTAEIGETTLDLLQLPRMVNYVEVLDALIYLGDTEIPMSILSKSGSLQVTELRGVIDYYEDYRDISKIVTIFKKYFEIAKLPSDFEKLYEGYVTDTYGTILTRMVAQVHHAGEDLEVEDDYYLFLLDKYPRLMDIALGEFDETMRRRISYQDYNVYKPSVETLLIVLLEEYYDLKLPNTVFDIEILENDEMLRKILRILCSESREVLTFYPNMGLTPEELCEVLEELYLDSEPLLTHNLDAVKFYLEILLPEKLEVLTSNRI